MDIHGRGARRNDIPMRRRLEQAHGGRSVGGAGKRSASGDGVMATGSDSSGIRQPRREFASRQAQLRRYLMLPRVFTSNTDVQGGLYGAGAFVRAA
jgi:hypothetical protein